MILRRRASLGTVHLDGVDDSIVIRGIDPGVPKENITAVDKMGGAGQRVTGSHWQTLEASVTYAIDIPKRQMTRRREVFDAVNAWAAKKGWLRMTEMPGRKMYADKVILPGSGDLWDWTAEYTIVFRAYNVPFWQDNEAARFESRTAAEGSVTAEVGGTARSVLDITFENKSGKVINNFWVEANGNRITLTGLNLGGSEKLTISHRTDGLLQMKAGSRNVYTKYTGADDLYVEPGNVAVTFKADRAGILTASSTGRWL